MNADDFQKFCFEAPLTTGETVSHDVYFAGNGPAILLIQELPGIEPDTFALAQMLIGQGYGFATVIRSPTGQLRKAVHTDVKI